MKMLLKNNLTCCFTLLLWFLTLQGRAQDTRILTYDEFIGGLATHPMTLQAGLKSEMGSSVLKQAKGGFDPVVQSAFNAKSFDGTNYYNLQQANIQIPTRTPLRFTGGVERNSGSYLNPQALTPEGGQWYAGLNFPLLQGLITDARRTAWQQAVAYNDFTSAERDKYELTLWFDASKTYADWWNAAEKTNISLELTELARERFGAVKERAEAGDLPRIDTVEAVIQLRLREQQLAESYVRETTMRMLLSNFLWVTSAEGDPVAVDPGLELRPAEWPFNQAIQFTQIQMDTLMANMEDHQPLLRQVDADIRGMGADLKWKKEQRKPQLDITYVSLGYLNTNDGSAMPDGTDYIAGIQFRYPLLNRSARGAATLQELKMNDRQLEMSMLETRIANQAKALFENISLLQQQLELNTANVDAFNLLLDVEKEKFFNGESSLFLVNQREMAYIDARFRLADLRSGLFKSQCELQYTIGLIP